MNRVKKLSLSSVLYMYMFLFAKITCLLLSAHRILYVPEISHQSLKFSFLYVIVLIFNALIVFIL
jgi:hypothetical protein